MENSLSVCENLIVTPSEHFDRMPLCEDYVSILRLAQKCANQRIPYTLQRCWDGWIVVFKKDGIRVADVVEHKISYGHQEDLLETMGFQEDGDDVSGWLTADEVWERVSALYHPRLESCSAMTTILAD